MFLLIAVAMLVIFFIAVWRQSSPADTEPQRPVQRFPNREIRQTLQPLREETRKPTQAGNIRGKALIIDVETTGMSRSVDEVIELAALLVDYDCNLQDVFHIHDRYCGFREPTVPIDPRAGAVHGITAAMLQGKSLDERRIRTLIESADFIVAHNASFDRAFFERLFSEFGNKPWLCSLSESTGIERVPLRSRYLAWQNTFDFL
jgi:DNA polymerase-3 subunit epsilon